MREDTRERRREDQEVEKTDTDHAVEMTDEIEEIEVAVEIENTEGIPVKKIDTGEEDPEAVTEENEEDLE